MNIYIYIYIYMHACIHSYMQNTLYTCFGFGPGLGDFLISYRPHFSMRLNGFIMVSGSGFRAHVLFMVWGLA